ncbi:hypothetical protein VIBNISO65_1740025 [Vibrio nigripulchritudo SO65]|nr:hypothetical protein VIBNIAM115_1990024 [Vibrio nigripulchritudo AM115]CCN76984.1 hypothetical protein VIBNISO65_1740025 [Vibrio nigripulchritudo SO65]
MPKMNRFVRSIKKNIRIIQDGIPYYEREAERQIWSVLVKTFGWSVL